MKQDDAAGFVDALRYLLDESRKLDAPDVTLHLERALQASEKYHPQPSKAGSKLNKVHPDRLDNRQRPA